MGFSGWDGPKEHKLRKNRKAFDKAKLLYRPELKYGDQFGKGGFELDGKRVERLEREKQNRWYLTFFGVAILGVIISFCVLEYVLVPQVNESISSYTKERYDWRVHGTDATIREIENIKFFKQGYIAWGQGEYEAAIRWFERSGNTTKNQWQKEYALLGVYSDRCYHYKKDCIKYEAYRSLILDQLKGQISIEREVQYFQDVIHYNKQMITYFENKNK